MIENKESVFVRELSASLRKQGFHVRTEVSNMGQSADLVATRGRWVTIIEAKLGDWKRAIAQCRAHEHIADYICIALGSVSVSDRLRDTASELGYGVIHYNRSVKRFDWVLRPKLNRAVWRPQRKYWANMVRKQNYGN